MPYTEPPFENDIQAALSLVAEIAKPFMEPPLSYHKWEHIEYSFNYAMKKCDEYEKADKPVDRLMVGCAILLHDAKISHELPPEFNTAEDYSAHIAKQELTRFGFSDAFLEGVENCIKATNYDATPETDEEKLTCMADIANIFDKYEVFVWNAFALMKELMETTNKVGTLREFRGLSRDVVSSYLFKDLVIVPSIDRDITGMPIYEASGMKNLNRFMRASSIQIKATLLSIGGTAANGFLELVPEPVKRAKL